MEGTQAAGGGTLKIVSATGGGFTFNALDFAAFDTSGAGSQTLMVEGLLGGSLLGTDQYTLANTNIAFPKYQNWTTETASILAGKIIDELDIPLNAGTAPDFREAIDNVVLTPVSAVPEPASLALLASGLLGWRFARRRKT